MRDINDLIGEILRAYRDHKAPKVFTVAVSGIDASGKGFVTRLLEEALNTRGYKVANINIDPWQNPLPIRLRRENAAENFYHNVFRWQDFFGRLIKPLQENKNFRLETNLIRTDADQFYPFTYQYNDTDIILIDGILLFQERFFSFYDYKVWINCSFEKGLERAVNRNSEKLDAAQLISDYQTYYYPAQRLHFVKDRPTDHADFVFDNESQKQ